MTTIISADNGTVSGSAGLKSTADSSGILALQTGANTTAVTIDASQNVTFVNQPTYSAGTANGVAYLNGSKVLTSGSALTFDGTNLTTTGNFIPSTAAKGINFTANTAAAGMTSQLLNWYEQGTWTPVVTASVGTLGTSTVTYATYTRIGRQVFITYDFTINSNGSGSSSIKVSGLPFVSSGRGNGVGFEAAVVGFATVQQTVGGTSYFLILKYDGTTYPGGTSYELIGSVTYIV